MRALRIIGLHGVPEVKPGHDLARLLMTAAASQGCALEAGDLLVVTHKVVSKQEGRVADLALVRPSAFARTLGAANGKDPRLLEVILGETMRIVRMDRGVLICETRHGLVCANAGVDKSNVPGKDMVVLLPLDPDASARRLMDEVGRLTGLEVPVIISDTFGRPWREGLVNFAIGVAGMTPIADYTGTFDACGNELRVSRLAVADELAAAAELVMGKTEGVPAAVVRGYAWSPGAGTAGDLRRKPASDLFR